MLGVSSRFSTIFRSLQVHAKPQTPKNLKTSAKKLFFHFTLQMIYLLFLETIFFLALGTFYGKFYIHTSCGMSLGFGNFHTDIGQCFCVLCSKPSRLLEMWTPYTLNCRIKLANPSVQSLA